MSKEQKDTKPETLDNCRGLQSASCGSWKGNLFLHQPCPHFRTLFLTCACSRRSALAAGNLTSVLSSWNSMFRLQDYPNSNSKSAQKLPTTTIVQGGLLLLSSSSVVERSLFLIFSPKSLLDRQRRRQKEKDGQRASFQYSFGKHVQQLGLVQG